MKKIAYLAASVVTALMTTSCSDSFDVQLAAGEGRLLLRPSVSTDLKVSRSIDEEDLSKLNESCLIWISSSRGLVRQYEGIESVPTGGIWLAGGQYTAEAWAGDSVPASFEQRYFKGVSPFTIGAGDVLQVDLKCTIANSAVSVQYSEEVDDVLSDYTLTVGHSCGSLTWTGRDDRRGYFMMNSRDKDLTYTLQGTKQDGSVYKLEGTITDAKPATEYVLNVKYNGVDVERGGAYFTIEIDDSTIPEEDVIQIISAPTIASIYQSIDTPVYGEAGKMSRQGFYVSAATELKSVFVSAPSMADLLDVDNGEFDMIRADASVIEKLYALGVRSTRNRDVENDLDNVKITFEEDLLNQLTDGEYTITVSATVSVNVDDNRTVDKTNTVTMTIVVSDADVEAEQIAKNDPSIWATEVTLNGKVLKDGVETAGFRYREKDTEPWSYAEGVTSRAIAKGTPYSATLSDLKPGTTYEYVAVAGDFEANDIFEFTTEEATQLPNAGFEDWYMDGKIQRISSSAADMFWDSGNKGSATVNTTLTGPCENPKHGGNYSAQLSSKKVAIAFAAGNLFVGEFLGTESLTKGILGWGRPWNTRPRALKGYVKYTPMPISDVSGSPAGVTINKGDSDQGIIYIGIVDNSTMSYGNYSGWPQIVATKDIDNYGFKSTDAKVIAYGEKVFAEATEGDGLIEFEIQLDYHRRDIKAGNIIIVASASRYGDYYTGGDGSVMYLDDFELVY